MSGSVAAERRRGATTGGGSGAASSGGGGGRVVSGGSRSGVVSSGNINVSVDVVVSTDLAEASVHLRLIDTQLLRDLSSGSAANTLRVGVSVTVLPLGSGSSLDLRTINVLDVNVPTNRLRERRGGGSQNHSQHSCQQHYFPHSVPPCLRIDLTTSIFLPIHPNVNTVQHNFFYFLKQT